MYHIMFEERDSYKVAILLKTEALVDAPVREYYLDPMVKMGVPVEEFIAFSLEYGGHKKPNKAYMMTYLEDLLPELKALNVKYLYCTDGNYFKALTKLTTAEPHLGYVLPCKIKGYEDMEVILSSSHRAIFANDATVGKITRANETLATTYKGSYVKPGTGIIKSAIYVESDAVKIKEELTKLLHYPMLTADIEAFSLKHTKAGIGTIAFAYSIGEGIAIDVMHKEGSTAWLPKYDEIYGVLRWFFETYQGTVVWHRCTYDVKVLIYELYMEHMQDTEGLLRGLEILTKNFDDTKLIAYLATNTCSENPLGLKHLAHEFAGNYAQSEINNIAKIGSKELLEYNLVDCLSTWYVYEKYYPLMVKDEQEHIYKTLIKPMLIKNLQTELSGMPICMERAREVDKILEDIIIKSKETLAASKIIKDFSYIMREKKLVARNAALKKKVLTIDEVTFTFNPNSNKHVAALLHEFLNFEVTSTTATGQPSVDGSSLKGHMLRTDNPEIKGILQAILDMLEAAKIRNTFVARYLEAEEHDGWHYLFGNFEVCGTISGRPSASNPNLLNQPSKGYMGKLVKSCFRPPKGKLFVGSDFTGLEDVGNTLLTRDRNKMKVFLEGFDGHSLRARYFFSSKLSHIDPEDDTAVNSIKIDYPDLRSDAKAPHFTLQYGGTWRALHVNCGFSVEVAKEMEASYRQLYAESYAWVQDKLDKAANDGYVTLAFGLRLRTPVLRKTILGSTFTPAQAASESKSAGNAVSGQSYGLLNSRAGVEFQRRVLASPYRLDIVPIAEIYDALYYVISDRIEVVEWVNKNLIECMKWQELPELQHDTIKLSSELDICYPTWADPITVPNGASGWEIYNQCRKEVSARQSK